MVKTLRMNGRKQRMKFWTYVEDANGRHLQNSEGLFVEEECKDLGA